MIVLLGGFLGAGKTSLILSAARILQGQGIRTAAILNDQGTELADTRWVQSQGLQVDQVTGGCFCCLFSDLVQAAENLRAHSAEVIFAEAVGSCTDVSATTLQPLRLYYRDKFQLAPYTVLVDPGRAERLTGGGDPEFTFLFNKQLEEADLVCFTKSDLYSEFPALGAGPFRCLSSLTGDGVRAWLDEILAGTLASGTKILDIDYEHYADAEARLAWLNCSAFLTLANDAALPPAAVIGPLLESLEANLTTENFQIAHVKITDDTPAGTLKASVVANRAAPVIEGDLSASSTVRHELLLNVRAAGDPERLQQIVERQLLRLPGKVDIRSMQCFKPSAPSPQHRFNQVAEHV